MKTKTPDFMLIKGGDVFAPQPLGHKDILIVHERILAIADRLELPPGFDGETLHAQGQIVVPGLVDGHVHIAGGGGEGGFQNRTPPASIDALVQAGITTAIGLLGTDAVTRSVSSLLAEARRIQVLGLSAYIYTGAYQVPTRTITQNVRQDLILITEVVGAGEIAIADDRGSHPSDRDLIDLASEVHVGALLAGKKGIVQLHVGDDPEGLATLFRTLKTVHLPIDLFLPTHLNRRAPLLQDALKYARMGGRIDLTSGIFPAPGDDQPVNPAKAMADLLHHGVPVEQLSMSSDSFGSSPVFDDKGRLKGVGIGKPDTLWRFAKEAICHHNVRLRDALRTVTQNPAEALGLNHKGRLVEGADADLLIMDRDLNLHTMIARGKQLMHDGSVYDLNPFSMSDESERMVSPHTAGKPHGSPTQDQF